MAAALVSAEDRRPEAARREHFAAGRVLGRDFGSDRPAAGPELGRNGCRTAQATDQNQPQFALAFSRPTQHHSQKKPCKQPNGSEQMWRERSNVSLRIARDIGFRLKHRASRAGGYQESSALQRSGSMLRSSSRAPHGGSPRSMLDRSCRPRLWSPLLP